jgi:hypothetical protein
MRLSKESTIAEVSAVNLIELSCAVPGPLLAQEAN